MKDIYSKGFIKDEYIEKGYINLNEELDANIINLTRILTEISGLVKKRHKKLSLTLKGKQYLNDDYLLLNTLFITFGTIFNWAYYDNFGDNQIGQLGFGFSLILLGKYGNEKRYSNFYAHKYFNAFPRILDNIYDNNYFDTGISELNCYSVRTFERFLDYFGVIKIYKGEDIFDKIYVKKTELFDKLINIDPPERILDD